MYWKYRFVFLMCGVVQLFVTALWIFAIVWAVRVAAVVEPPLLGMLDCLVLFFCSLAVWYISIRVQINKLRKAKLELTSESIPKAARIRSIVETAAKNCSVRVPESLFVSEKSGVYIAAMLFLSQGPNLLAMTEEIFALEDSDIEAVVHHEFAHGFVLLGQLSNFIAVSMSIWVAISLLRIEGLMSNDATSSITPWIVGIAASVLFNLFARVMLGRASEIFSDCRAALTLGSTEKMSSMLEKLLNLVNLIELETPKSTLDSILDRLTSILLRRHPTTKFRLRVIAWLGK